MDLAGFKERYPEFATASDTQIQDALDDAALELAPPGDSPWFDLYDRGHGLLAAHNLSLSPSGKNARLDPKGPETTYGTKYIALREQVTCGLRVFNGCQSQR